MHQGCVSGPFWFVWLRVVKPLLCGQVWKRHHQPHPFLQGPHVLCSSRLYTWSWLTLSYHKFRAVNYTDSYIFLFRATGWSDFQVFLWIGFIFMVSGWGWALLIVHLSLLAVIGGALDGALNFPLFSFLSFSFFFLAFLQIWCLHSNPSRRLKVFYVLCMLSPLIGTHGCKLFMSINLQILSSLSLSSCSSPHCWTHMCTRLRTLNPPWDSNAGVRRVLKTALNLSEALMPAGFNCPRLVLKFLGILPTELINRI